MTNISKAKTRAHIRYKTSDGTVVPGVTTITGQLNKPALVAWANRLGLQGIDSAKYRDEAADIGTLAHYLALCDIKGIQPELADYTQNQIDTAETCFLKYLDWRKDHTIEPFKVEEPIVSDNMLYGGTPDLPCVFDDVKTLVDFKTGQAIYTEYFYQLAGYDGLLKEVCKFYPGKWIIVRMGRSESEGFEVKTVNNIQPYWEVFSCLLDLYYRIKESKGK